MGKPLPHPETREISPSVWSIVNDPVVSSVLAPFFLLSILNTSMLVVFSLFAYTPIEFGGLSRDVSCLAIVLAYMKVVLTVSI